MSHEINPPAATAEKEAQAQLEIIQALKKTTPERAKRVMNAVWHILQAEVNVPGVMDTITNARKGDS